MNVFYKASALTRCSDIIPFYDGGRFKPFYLKRWPPGYQGADSDPGWRLLESDDLVHFEEYPTGIVGATGCVIKADNEYHMFYCTLTSEAQIIHHATSTDLRVWHKHPQDSFRPDDHYYAMSDWRDAFVFFHEGEQKWWMLVCAAQKDALTGRSGCIGLCVSDDLKHWECRPPFYAPGFHQSALECPDLFKMGDWYYLLYSTSTEKFQTYYRMSRSIDGPWLAPAVDSFDGRAYYAAKTAFDGENRYSFAWSPAKEYDTLAFNPQSYPGKDYNAWDHGGTMVVHKLVQHADGTLGVKLPEMVEAAFSHQAGMAFTPLQGNWRCEGDSYCCDSPHAYACALLGIVCEVCKLEMNLRFTGEPIQFGVAAEVDERFSEGYYFCLQPARNRIEWKSAIRMYEHGAIRLPYEVELERPIRLEPERNYRLCLINQKDLMVLYLDDDVALCTRKFDYAARRFGLFVANGNAVFSNIRLTLTE